MENDENKKHGCQPKEEPAKESLNPFKLRKMVIVLEYDPLKAEKAAAAYRAFKAAMDAMGIKISAKRVNCSSSDLIGI